MNIRLAIAIIQFLIQFLKWMNKAEQAHRRTAHTKAYKFETFTKALKAAEEGKVEELEKMFAIIKP